MLKTLKDVDLKGKKIFLRVDFNVPMKDGVVGDDTRIREALKTINYILEHGGLLTVVSHLGRPKGEKNPKYSMKPVVDYINSKKYFNAKYVEDCVGKPVADALAAQQANTVLVLENVRYYAAEEKNEPEFAKQLATGFDVYVNDAFGTCHRKHASVYGVPALMPVRAMGLLIEKEVKYFAKIVNVPDRPFAAILGGAKVSDKIGVIESLLDKADKILVGGAMAFTFLKYQGHSTGTSLVEQDQFDTVKTILAKAKAKDVEVILPIDFLISPEFNGKPEVCDGVEIPEGKMGLDIGTKSTELYTRELHGCKTILWNGPMGVFENDDYAKATFAIANTLASLDAVTVIGGGDSVAAVNKAGIADKMSHISTGGGASLEYVEYGSLPGIEILNS